jgi:uncharacterized membrane protein
VTHILLGNGDNGTTASEGMSDDSAAADQPTTFQVVLYPNQPPPARSLVILLVGIFGVAIGTSIGFILAGAWPVVGFLGVELVLLVVCLIWARRMARYAEHIRLDDGGLFIRTTAGERTLRTWRFEPYWTRVQLAEIRPGETALRLSAHGRTLTIGRFLNGKERTDVAAELEAALRRHRQPAV